MILMYIFFHQECQNNQMMTNALDNQITPRPEKSKGCCISASPIRQNRIYNRSSAANVEQTEKLLENQEKKE